MTRRSAPSGLAEINAVTLRESVADLGDLHSCAFACRAHVHRERVESPDPEVVALPLDDLVELPEVDTTADRAAARSAYLLC